MQILSLQPRIPKVFSLTRTIFFTVGQNNFGKKIQFPSAFPGHRRWLMPRGFFEDPDFSKVFPTLKDEVLKITDNDKKFEISVDTHGYKPEEMQVKVLDDVVTVEAKHEEKKSEENNKSFVSRQFSR